MVDAKVVVTDNGTNVAYTTTTSQAGLFTVPYLEAGTYSVSITKTGFETYAVAGLHLASSQTARVNATLQVGLISSKVEVQASAAQLQTDSSTISAGISSIVIDAIPNITENPSTTPPCKMEFSHEMKPPIVKLLTHLGLELLVAPSSPRLA